MIYPHWDVPFLGGGLVIAIISIAHVFIASFAVGGGIYLALTETIARRRGDTEVLEFLKQKTGLFVMLTLVFGATSGVGIWFSIGLVAPEATGTLLRVFVWVWAIESVVFLVEVVAALLYYYGWDRLDARTHVRIGWIYAGTAWLSLVLVNSILSFMLTPGDWVETRSLADAWFNPSAAPSLLLRTSACIALAGLYSFVAASMLADEALRLRLIRYSAKWLMPAFLLMPLAGIWYAQVIPAEAIDIATGGAPPVMIFLGLSLGLSLVIFVFAFLFPLRRPQWSGPGLAIMMLLMGFMVTATGEWVREAIRKPYLIHGYMYSNGYRVGEPPQPTALPLDPMERGRHLFQAQCASCHEPRGYNGLDYLVRGWDEDLIYEQVGRLDTLKGYMPPFMGTSEDRHALAKWIHSINEP